MKNVIRLLSLSIILILLGHVIINANTSKEHLSSQLMRVEAGWNLLSLPASVSDGIKSSIFPHATSNAFIYQNGYVPKDTLQNGFGFWLKFDSSETVSISGSTIFVDTIAVSAGWNMIGSLSSPVAVSKIKTEPTGIIDSKYYSFVPGVGYQQTDTIQPGKGYWVKVNQSGVVFLSAMGTPCPDVPTVDYAGKTYNTVQIGNQCWLKENLDVGTMIDSLQNQTDNGTIEKYCYNNDTNNCDTYGGLYQWNETIQYSTTPDGVRGICPSEWHIPTLAEFQTLSTAVGGDGNALKEIGQGTGAGAGTNTSGFSALLSGIWDDYEGFRGLGSNTYFWSSTKQWTNTAHFTVLDDIDNSIIIYDYYKVSGFSVRCVKDFTGPNYPPTIPSNPIPTDSAVGQPFNVTLKWSACSDLEADLITYDVYFGIDNPPTEKISFDQIDTSLVRNGLINSTQYYWKVVAEDNHGNSAEGPVWRFTTGVPCFGIATVTYEGKTYNTVQIGNQCWLKENLDVGKMIDSLQNQTNNDTIEKYCYNNDPNNCTTYGGLYQWNEAMHYTTITGTQGICPSSWHIPTLDEFYTLNTTVGGDGNALKEIGQGTGAGAGTNTSGFSALLSGGRGYSGFFGSLGNYSTFWTSLYIGNFASLINLYAINSSITFTFAEKEYGYSVRCVKD